jgi:hypothetical protein
VPSFKDKSTALVVGIMWGCVLPKKLVSPLEFGLNR